MNIKARCFTATVLALLLIPFSVSAQDSSIYWQCPEETANHPGAGTAVNATDPEDIFVRKTNLDGSATKCDHLTAGDGITTMADDKEGGLGKRLYIFGFNRVAAPGETVSSLSHEIVDGVELPTTAPDVASGNYPSWVMEQGTFAANAPAPTIVMNEDDEFFLNLTNTGMIQRPDLFDPHTVHFHGFPNASAIFDGLPDASIAINMGATLTYYYQPKDAGTYMYHCHVEATEHMQMGMLGNLFVRPRQDRCETFDASYPESMPAQLAALPGQISDAEAAIDSYLGSLGNIAPLNSLTPAELLAYLNTVYAYVAANPGFNWETGLGLRNWIRDNIFTTGGNGLRNNQSNRLAAIFRDGYKSANDTLVALLDKQAQLPELIARYEGVPGTTCPAGHTPGVSHYVYDNDNGSTRYDVEVPIQLGSFDPDFHDASFSTQALPFATMRDRYFLLNGRGYPDTTSTDTLSTVDELGRTQYSQPVNTVIKATPGQRILLRISNLNVTDIYTVGVNGLPMQVVGLDARLLQDDDGNDMSYKTNSITIGGGQSADVIIDTTGMALGQTFFFYTKNLDKLANDAENLGGMMTEIQIQAPL